MIAGITVSNNKSDGIRLSGNTHPASNFVAVTDNQDGIRVENGMASFQATYIGSNSGAGMLLNNGRKASLPSVPLENGSWTGKPPETNAMIHPEFLSGDGLSVIHPEFLASETTSVIHPEFLPSLVVEKNGGGGVQVENFQGGPGLGGKADGHEEGIRLEGAWITENTGFGVDGDAPMWSW